MRLIKILLITLFFNTFAYADKNMKIGSKGKERVKFQEQLKL